MIKVEKNIPIPKSTQGREYKYPLLATMKVKESFFVKGKTARQLAGNIDYVIKKTGRKFLSRTLDGGVRIWRIK